MSAKNRELARAYYTALYSPDHDAAIAKYLSDDYVEHQYTTGFTKAGLRDYVKGRLAQYPEHRVVIHHALSDGELAFLFVEEKLGGKVDYARAELFRIADGKIVEHWGSHVLDEKNRKNPNNTWDGPQVDRSTDYAKRFAAQFEAMDIRGFHDQELETFGQSRTPEYKQHSPKGGDGCAGLVDILQKAKDNGIKTSMTCYRTLTDGDFIVSHRLYDTKPTHPLMNRIYTFDMFRMNADGKAVEHWDVMDDVPDESMLAKMI